MAVRLSRLYGMDIYTVEAQYLGKVSDIILDLEAGAVVRLTTEPLKTTSKEKAKRILKEKSILYSSVVSVQDIIIVSPGKEQEVSAAEEEAVLRYGRK